MATAAADRPAASGSPAFPWPTRRWRSPQAVTVVVGVLSVVLAVARGLVLARHGEPVGIDVGNWVSIGYTLTGQGFTGTGTLAAPLVPLLARALAAGVGLAVTSWALGATAATAAGLGVWWALRRHVPPWWAAWGGLLVVVAGATSAAAAWGGYPQLLGLAALPCAAEAGARHATSPRAGRRSALVLGGWTAAVAASSHLAVAWAVPGVALALVLGGARSGRWSWIRSLPWAAIPVLPLVPLYAVLATRLDPVADGWGPVSLSASLEVVLVGGRGWWLALGALAVVGLARWSVTTDLAGWTTATSLLLAAALAAAAGPDERFAFALPTAIGWAAAWALARTAEAGTWPARGALVVAGTAAAALVLAAPGVQVDQRNHYGRFTPPGTLATVDALAHLSRSDDLVAAAPVDGAPFGWIVQGGAHRSTLVASLPEWLYVEAERERAALAIAIFTDPDWPSDLTFERARAAGVRWLVVPATWGGVDEAALASQRARHPGLVAVSNQGNLVLRVPGG